MTSAQLRTLSGYALVAAAVLCLAGGLLHPIVDGHAHSAEAVLGSTGHLSAAALLAGTLLLVLGLPAVYGWLAPRLGVLGLIGYLAYTAGNLLSAMTHVLVNAFIAPEVARRAPELISHQDMIIDAPAFAAEQVATGMLYLAGLLLFGIALLRSGAVPRWVGALGVAGALLVLVPLPVLPVVTALQVELARGLMAAALGVLAVRSARAVPAVERRELVAA